MGENSKIPNVNGMRCDVVNALKEINISVLRWPGGCYVEFRAAFKAQKCPILQTEKGD